LLPFSPEPFLVCCQKNVKIITYKTIILPVILYGCDIEEHRPRVFENTMLRTIFELMTDEVIRGWRKLHNKELHNFYCSPSIIRMIKSRRMRWAGHLACMGRKEECL
jgi:hypothetical protein